MTDDEKGTFRERRLALYTAKQILTDQKAVVMDAQADVRRAENTVEAAFNRLLGSIPDGAGQEIAFQVPWPQMHYGEEKNRWWMGLGLISGGLREAVPLARILGEPVEFIGKRDSLNGRDFVVAPDALLDEVLTEWNNILNAGAER